MSNHIANPLLAWLRRSAGLLLGLLITLGAVQAAEPGLSDYRLGVGDQVQIQVFGEDDLSIEARLSDAGTISYPFLGELKVLGLSVGELEARVTEGLKGPYLVDPRVNVTIIEYRQFFINGEVKKSGAYPFQPGLTVRKAVALAGGFTERAARKQVHVRRDSEQGGNALVMPLSAQVMPGDIISVEESFF